MKISWILGLFLAVVMTFVVFIFEQEKKTRKTIGKTDKKTGSDCGDQGQGRG